MPEDTLIRFATQFWPKMLFDIALLAFLLIIKRGKKDQYLDRFLLLVPILMVRDVVFVFTGWTMIISISDMIIAAFLLNWLSLFTGSSRFYNVIYLFLTIVGVIAVVLLFTDKIGALHLRFIRSLITIAWVMIATQYYRISIYNMESPEGAVIIYMRKTVITLMMVSQALLLIFTEQNDYIHLFLLPLMSIAYIYALWAYDKYQYEQKNENITMLESDLSQLFEFMRTMGNAISEKLEISLVLDYVAEAARQNLGADGGAILLVDDYDNTLQLRSVAGIFPPPYNVTGPNVRSKLDNLMEYFRSTPIPIGEGVLGEAVQKGEPVFIKNSYNDPRMIQNTRNDLLFISSLIIIPLIVGDKTLGVLSVCRRDRHKLFEETDFNNIKTFADYTSLSLDNIITYMELLDKKEMEREVGIAADIQQKLLPARLPKLKNVSLSAFSIPAKGVSGDYYDIIPLKKGKVALVICDVAGKGVPASLVMIMIRTIIQLIAGATRDASTIVTWINRGITGKIDIDHYATLSFLTYDTNTRTIEYSNAGHHPLMIYRKDKGIIENLDTQGLPIGIEATSSYEHKSIQLNPGDLILCYTDGIIEAMNTKGEQYEYDSLVNFVKENSELSPMELSKAINKDINKFVGKAKQHDDQTLLVMKAD